MWSWKSVNSSRLVRECATEMWLLLISECHLARKPTDHRIAYCNVLKVEQYRLRASSFVHWAENSIVRTAIAVYKTVWFALEIVLVEEALELGRNVRDMLVHGRKLFHLESIFYVFVDQKLSDQSSADGRKGWGPWRSCRWFIRSLC